MISLLPQTIIGAIADRGPAPDLSELAGRVERRRHVSSGADVERLIRMSRGALISPPEEQANPIRNRRG